MSHKYTSQELDSGTGLYYYIARYYDPVLSKFISPDPVGPDLSNPQGLNRYSYVLNNPLKYVDPSGNYLEYRGYTGDWLSDITTSFYNFTATVLNTLETGLRILPGTGDIYDVTDALSYRLYGEEIPPDLAFALMVGGISRTNLKLGKEAGQTLGTLRKVAQQVDGMVSRSGRIGGILKHSEAEKLQKGSREFSAEISYLNGDVVSRGTPGSIRVDVITGPVDNPTAVFDYKFGSTGLTPARINRIRSHLPDPNIPIYEVRP